MEKILLPSQEIDPPPSTEEIIDAVEDETEEVDELVAQLSALSAISETRHTQILERTDACRVELERLSTIPQAESPLLTQLLNQMIEIRTELTSLKLSMDLRLSPPTQTIPRESVESESLQETRTDLSERSEEENPAEEIPPIPVAKKNRFV